MSRLAVIDDESDNVNNTEVLIYYLFNELIRLHPNDAHRLIEKWNKGNTHLELKWNESKNILE